MGEYDEILKQFKEHQAKSTKRYVGKILLGLIIGSTCLVLLWINYGWRLAVLIFLLLWANNLSNSQNKL